MSQPTLVIVSINMWTGTPGALSILEMPPPYSAWVYVGTFYSYYYTGTMTMSFIVPADGYFDIYAPGGPTLDGTVGITYLTL